MFGIGTPELIIILLIVLLLVGGKKLPELARSVGQSMQELRKGMSDGSKKTTTRSSEEAEEA
ncbi:MAG: twin-arginine translocase TatA/TatE family subunit [Candidatus Nomurabacteria bacterium]|nr:MAG: twin-arginine translocase TatA/TatE family subunit [Candidatus Nomurabacteria bacterium]